MYVQSVGGIYEAYRHILAILAAILECCIIIGNACGNCISKNKFSVFGDIKINIWKPIWCSYDSYDWIKVSYSIYGGHLGFRSLC